MIVFLARDIQAFVMYCVNGTSCSSLLIESTDSMIHIAHAIYTNKTKRNLFACLFRMSGHALYGMAPYFGRTGVTFDGENDRPGPGILQGHFEAARGCFLRLKTLF